MKYSIKWNIVARKIIVLSLVVGKMPPYYWLYEDDHLYFNRVSSGKKTT